MMFYALIYSLLVLLSPVVAGKMTWKDNSDMVKSTESQIVVPLGGNGELVCQVDQPSLKSEDKFDWSIDGKLLTNHDIHSTVTKEKGDLFIISHLKISNVTLAMDGVRVACTYYEFIEEFGSWNNIGTLEADLIVFKPAAENIDRHGEDVQKIMKGKIAELKNIVALNPELMTDDTASNQTQFQEQILETRSGLKHQLTTTNNHLIPISNNTNHQPPTNNHLPPPMMNIGLQFGKYKYLHFENL